MPFIQICFMKMKKIAWSGRFGLLNSGYKTIFRRDISLKAFYNMCDVLATFFYAT